MSHSQWWAELGYDPQSELESQCSSRSIMLVFRGQYREEMKHGRRIGGRRRAREKDRAEEKGAGRVRQR